MKAYCPNCHEEVFGPHECSIKAKYDPWIASKEDKWFIHNDKRIHKESWNAAIDAAIEEVEKVYPYSAKEIKIMRDNMK